MLEKWGTDYFRKLSHQVGEVEPDDDIHFLNERERRDLRRIERGAVFRACLAGALSAIVSGGASFYAWDLLENGDDMVKTVEYWVIVGGVTGIATVFEIGFLYWDALRSVHRMSVAAGLDLIPQGEEETAVLNALVRAALEMPNPSDRDRFINPRKETSGMMLLMTTLIYKGKVTVTNFLLKALARRVLGRVMARAYMEFIAVPVTAVWNGVVCWWVVREARIRAMGPSAVKEMVGMVLGGKVDSLSPKCRLALRRAVGSSIVRTSDLHPNLHQLIRRVREMVGTDDAEIDNSRLFLETIRGLDPPEQILVIKILGIAMVIDGKLARMEKKLWLEASQICGLDGSIQPIRHLMKVFRNGKPIQMADIEALASKAGSS